MKIVPKIDDRMYKHGKFSHILSNWDDLLWYVKIINGHSVLYALDLLWHHECDDAEMAGWNLIGCG